MADLFVTVQDLTTGKKFYEIYVRREISETLDYSKQSTSTTTVSSKSFEGAAANSTTTTSTTEADNEQLTGLGSFCLVQREEVPEQIRNLFNFADIDRDGMIDMFYVNMQADSTGINLVVHYNALKNSDATRNDFKVSDALLVINNVCAPTNRPVDTLMDIFMAPDDVAATID